MGKSKARIGIIGLGYWGKNLLRNLVEMNLAAMACDTDPRIVRERSKVFNKVPYTTKPEILINNPSIDAIVISTPAATHYELVKRCLEAGKDVLVEKPLALSVKEGRLLVRRARRRRRLLMVGHLLHYHPAVVKLRQIVRRGLLGKIRYIYSTRLNIGKLRTEENILWSFAPHDLSVILRLIGHRPVRISASGASYVNKGVYDVTLTNLDFNNGVRAHIFVSWLHPFKEQKLVVVGSRSMAVFDDLNRDKLCLYPHRIRRQKGAGPVAYKAQGRPVAVEDAEPLKRELEHFADCVRSRRAPLTDGREGLRVLEVLDGIERAIKNR